MFALLSVFCSIIYVSGKIPENFRKVSWLIVGIHLSVSMDCYDQRARIETSTVCNSHDLAFWTVDYSPVIRFS